MSELDGVSCGKRECRIYMVAGNMYSVELCKQFKCQTDYNGLRSLIKVDLIKVNQEESSSKRGGLRKGAGRKPEVESHHSERFWKARGYNPLVAGEILQRATDELSTWKRILCSEDDRVVLQAMMFLVSMRDGKPAQAINVTSTNVTLNASDLASARAIVAEIRGEQQPKLGPASVTSDVTSTNNHSLMLGSDDGGDAGG